MGEIISILHGCMVWIGKSVMRVTDRHHEACLEYKYYISVTNSGV